MNMNNFPEPNIFKAYDIRGVVGVTLTIETVEKIGKALGSYALKKKQKKSVWVMTEDYQVQI